MSDLSHAVQFLQTAVAIVLGLALGEAFKQLVPDGDQDIRKDRVPSLVAFLFMIIPFFHGISRYFYVTYLTHAELKLGAVAGRVMFDGATFMTLAAMFFIMCRSLSPSHWVRFHFSLLALLCVDTLWIVVSIIYGVQLWSWLILNAILIALLVANLKFFYDKNVQSQIAPGWLCALYTSSTTLLSYLFMRDFYFP